MERPRGRRRRHPSRMIPSTPASAGDRSAGTALAYASRVRGPSASTTLGPNRSPPGSCGSPQSWMSARAGASHTRPRTRCSDPRASPRARRTPSQREVPSTPCTYRRGGLSSKRFCPWWPPAREASQAARACERSTGRPPSTPPTPRTTPERSPPLPPPSSLLSSPSRARLPKTVQAFFFVRFREVWWREQNVRDSESHRDGTDVVGGGVGAKGARPERKVRCGDQHRCLPQVVGLARPRRAKKMDRGRQIHG